MKATEILLRMAVACCVGLIGIAKAAPGDTDTSFGTQGYTTLPGPQTEPPLGGGVPEISTPVAIARDIQDRIYLLIQDPPVPIIELPGLYSRNHRIVRLTANGTLDDGFGAQGAIQLPQWVASIFGTTYRTLAIDDAAARILVAGDIGRPFVLRYGFDGMADTSFDGTRNQAPYGGQPTAIRVDAQGRILLAGQIPGYEPRVFVARWKPDGSLDPAFATEGVYQSPIVWPSSNGPGTGQPALAENANDGVLLCAGISDVAGSTPTRLMVIRLTTTGQPLAGFGMNGVRKIDSIPASDCRHVQFRNQGFSLLATGDGLTVARFTQAGEPDTAYADNGRLSDSFDSPPALVTLGSTPTQMTVQSGGKLVVAGPALDLAVSNPATIFISRVMGDDELKNNTGSSAEDGSHKNSGGGATGTWLVLVLGGIALGRSWPRWILDLRRQRPLTDVIPRRPHRARKRFELPGIPARRH